MVELDVAIQYNRSKPTGKFRTPACKTVTSLACQSQITRRDYCCIVKVIVHDNVLLEWGTSSLTGEGKEEMTVSSEPKGDERWGSPLASPGTHLYKCQHGQAVLTGCCGSPVQSSWARNRCWKSSASSSLMRSFSIGQRNPCQFTRT